MKEAASPHAADQPSQVRAAEMCVGLLDLLGQGRALAELEAKWSRSPRSQEAHSAIAESIARVENFRDQLKSQALLWSRSREAPFAARLSAEDRAELVRLRCVDFRTLAFSDTAGIYSSIGDDHGKPRMTAIYGIVASFAETMLTNLGAGVPLRGAVEVGLGYELPSGGLYGPALERAHGLESKVAAWPRVLVGPRLIALANSVAGTTPTSKRMFAEADAASQILGMVHQCADGHFMIDFLGTVLLEHARKAPQFNAVITSLRAFVERQVHAAADEGKVELLGRYAMLARYMHERLDSLSNA